VKEKHPKPTKEKKKEAHMFELTTPISKAAITKYVWVNADIGGTYANLGFAAVDANGERTGEHVRCTLTGEDFTDFMAGAEGPAYAALAAVQKLTGTVK